MKWSIYNVFHSFVCFRFSMVLIWNKCKHFSDHFPLFFQKSSMSCKLLCCNIPNSTSTTRRWRRRPSWSRVSSGATPPRSATRKAGMLQWSSKTSTGRTSSTSASRRVEMQLSSFSSDSGAVLLSYWFPNGTLRSCFLGISKVNSLKFCLEICIFCCKLVS